VHPTQPVETFGNVSMPFLLLPSAELHAKFYRDHPRGTSLSGVKRKRVAKYNNIGHVKGYISEMVQDTALGTIND